MPSDVVQLLQTLIRIPSVNPDCSADGTGEAAMADYVQSHLENIGYSVNQEEVLPGRPNVIARAPGSENRPRILLGPHLDTVSVAGMDMDTFGVISADGKVQGRGASDTKGPMASMLQALTNCQDILADLPVAVDFVGFMGEEASQHGSKHFARHHASEYEFAIAGEPTSLDMVNVTKGSLWATLTTSGKAAHASQPEQGDNAILKLARALDRFETRLSPLLAGYTHPILGISTVNVGTIKGGKQPNIVPDFAAAEIDIRFTPALSEDCGATSLVEQVITKQKLPLKVVNPHENPPMHVPDDHPWIKKLQAANPSSKPVGAPWFSDAAHLNAAGIPSICIGPGSVDQAHTKDEYISIDDLEAGVVYFENLVRSLA
ncbi:MAG: M20 family metallopeptidase [Verrucomicrobiae bacterium]|nr:M20 family metallopeptidase [Verrucomicrobiae bacterium]NNJ85575.1 M20 family metallopeptidase [Akkermansiaceae bacterium]